MELMEQDVEDLLQEEVLDRLEEVDLSDLDLLDEEVPLEMGEEDLSDPDLLDEEVPDLETEEEALGLLGEVDLLGLVCLPFFSKLIVF